MLVNCTPSRAVAATEVTSNIKVPGPRSCTMNWHVPPLVPPVEHVDAGSCVVLVPALVHVNAIDALAAGVVVFPSVAVAVITRSWCVPNGLAADGVTVTEYAAHVFVAVCDVNSIAFGVVVGFTMVNVVD